MSEGAAAFAEFEAARPRLLGLAYRLLGSYAEAEDAVQDTFLKWQAADRAQLRNAQAWLTTVCTRRCLDLLKAANRARVDYVGTWLPEPVETMTDDSPEALAASVSTAFLLLLDRLSPKERAAYLLYEIFDHGYDEIAGMLDLQSATCRKLVSRARAHLEKPHSRHSPPSARQDELLAAFQRAINDGSTRALSALLADDIALHADGGGKVAAASRVLRGQEEVLGFLTRVLSRAWPQWRQEPRQINGVRGMVVFEGEAIRASLTFGFDEAGRVSDIYIMRNPDKFGGLNPGRSGLA
jgi:RNA polymerase sigma-70 factor (ECF subfamily)